MLQQIINGVVPTLITAIIAVLVAIIKSVGDAVIQYMNQKKDLVIQQKGIEKYNSELQIGRQVWGIVEEYFRVNGIDKTIEDAQTKFKEEILKKIPYLTDDEIKFIEQAIAGEINKGKEAINTTTTTTIVK